MKILHTLPREDGFRMPAEFEPHRGCFMIWPERADSWANGGYAARRAFAKVITAIARSEKVTVLASFAQYENARVSLPPEVRVVEMSTDDAWARDITPTFVKNDKGELRGIDWGFNAWGGAKSRWNCWTPYPSASPHTAETLEQPAPSCSC